MSNSPFENPGDVTDRLRHWDHPDGLGWQLWRRVHATGLSTQQLQRALGRLRGHSLMDRASLAADIRRRWGLNQGPAVHRFSLDLPLFYARFPLFYASPPHEPLSSTLRPLRHTADVPLVSGLSRRSPLVGVSGLSRAIQMECPAQISSPTDTVFVRRGHDILNLEQTPRLSELSQGARSFGEAPGTATDNNVKESSHAGPHTEGGTQESAQRLVQRSTPAFDSINAKSDVKTFALTAASSKHQLSELHSPFIRHRDMLVLQRLMPQRLVEQAVQYLPLNRRTGPLSTAIWPPAQPLRRGAPPLVSAWPATRPGAGPALAPPTSGVLPRFPRSARRDAAGGPRLTVSPGAVVVGPLAAHRHAASAVQRGISTPHAPVVPSHPGAYTSTPQAPVVPSYPEMAAVRRRASPPGLFTPLAVFRVATPLARPLRWAALAGGSPTASPAFPRTHQVRRSVGEGQQGPLPWASERRAAGRQGSESRAGEEWRVPAMDSAAPVGPWMSTAIWPPAQPLRRGAPPLVSAWPATRPGAGPALAPPTSGVLPRFPRSARRDAAGGPRLTVSPGAVVAGHLAAHHHAAPAVQRGISTPHVPVVPSHPGAYTSTPQAPVVPSYPEMAAVRRGASLPGLFMPPAVFRVATPLARPLRWEPLAGGSPTASPAFSRTHQVMRSVGEGQQGLLPWASERRAVGGQGSESRAGEEWQAPMPRRGIGSRRAGYGSELATEQGWVLPIVESTLQDRFTLRRPLYPYHTAHTALHRFSSHAGAGDRAGNTRGPMSIMSLVQPYYDRETHLHQSNNPTQAITARLSATRHLPPIWGAEARTLAGTINLPTLALRTIQRDSITRSRPSGKGGPASYVEEPRSSLPGVIEGGFGAREGYSIIGIGRRGSLLNPGRARVDGFDEGYSLVQRSVSNLPAPLAIARWGETPAAVGDHRLTTSSAPGVIQPKEAVRPVWSRAVAATPAVMRSQAWPSIPALPLLHRLHPQAEHGEQTSTVVMREPAHDMPLVPARRRENRDNSLWDNRSTGVVVQTSPQSLASAPLGTAPTGSAENAEVLSTETGASRSQIDLDEVVEKAWQKFMRKLTIEQERRGYAR
jgi:hypothetical protein